MLAHAAAASAAQRADEEQRKPWQAREDGVERDPVGRPVGGENLADQILARHRSPAARVAGLRAVVAHEEVIALRDVPRVALAVAPVRLDVGLIELLAVDVDGAAAL